MPITITWDDGVTKPTSFTMPDEVIASLEQLRLTMRDTKPNSYGPIYADVKAMTIGVFMQQIITPALTLFPTAPMQAALDKVKTAKDELVAAQVAAIPDLAVIAVDPVEVVK